MKMLKCTEHDEIVYTLKESCPKCSKPTRNAHYKFLGLGDAKEKSSQKLSS